MKTFPTITSLKSGMKTNEIKFIDGDQTLPYVLGQDKLYHYFAQKITPLTVQGPSHTEIFVLVMTSSRDLQA